MKQEELFELYENKMEEIDIDSYQNLIRNSLVLEVGYGTVDDNLIEIDYYIVTREKRYYRLRINSFSIIDETNKNIELSAVEIEEKDFYTLIG